MSESSPSPSPLSHSVAFFHLTAHPVDDTLAGGGQIEREKEREKEKCRWRENEVEWERERERQREGKGLFSHLLEQGLG